MKGEVVLSTIFRSSHDMAWSQHTIFLQRLDQHCVFHILEHHAYVVGVGGTGEVRVNCLVFILLGVLRLLLVHLTDELHGCVRVPFLACKWSPMKKGQSHGS